jgi:hypothetical protein
VTDTTNWALVEPGGAVGLLPGMSATAFVLPPDLPYEEWAAIGHSLGRVGRAMHWWLGDWVMTGEHLYGEAYAQAASETGWNPDMLGQVQRVASRFCPPVGVEHPFLDSSPHSPLPRRREHLSWSHHATVAMLNPAEASYWLDRSEAEGLTVADLRRLLREARQEAEDGDPSESGAVVAKTGPDAKRTWEVIARATRDLAILPVKDRRGVGHWVERLPEARASELRVQVERASDTLAAVRSALRKVKPKAAKAKVTPTKRKR